MLCRKPGNATRSRRESISSRVTRRMRDSTSPRPGENSSRCRGRTFASFPFVDIDHPLADISRLSRTPGDKRAEILRRGNPRRGRPTRCGHGLRWSGRSTRRSAPANRGSIEIALHLIGAGGKRIRPLVAMSAFRACGGEDPRRHGRPRRRARADPLGHAPSRRHHRCRRSAQWAGHPPIFSSAPPTPS